MNEKRENFSVKTHRTVSPDRIEDAIGYVRDMVAMFRRRGLKSEHALPDVAATLELSLKRAKSLFYREIFAVACDEVEKIERRFVSHLDAEIALSIEYTESLRLKRDQISMRLECTNNDCSPLGSGCASTASASLWVA